MDKKTFFKEARIFLLMLLVISSLRSALADWNDVPTGSMKPTIQEGDRVVVNKLAYDLKIPFTTIEVAKWDNPKRGDIVVFFSPADGVRLVKRIVGLPGDHVAMRDNVLIINDKPVELSQVTPAGQTDQGITYIGDEVLGPKRHKVMLSPMIPAARTFDPITVPPNTYFVLGDNRDNSNDSRYIGFIERQRIVGRAVGVAFSLDRSHYYMPRFNRFFHGLV